MVALDLNTELYNEVKLRTNKKEGTESMMTKRKDNQIQNEQNTHTNPSWDK